MELKEPLETGGGNVVGTRGVETPGEHGLQNHGLTETEMTITDPVWVYDRSAYTLWLLNF